MNRSMSAGPLFFRLIKDSEDANDANGTHLPCPYALPAHRLRQRMHATSTSRSWREKASVRARLLVDLARTLFDGMPVLCGVPFAGKTASSHVITAQSGSVQQRCWPGSQRRRCKPR